MISLDFASLTRALIKLSRAKLPNEWNVFDILGISNKEQRLTFLLGHLLHPSRSPLGDALLQQFWTFGGAPQPIRADEVEVHTEYQRDQNRPDIVVLHRGLALVIENKIWSGEGEEQCAEYLKSFCADPDSRLIFLTPAGKPPPSVAPAHPQVKPLGFARLAEWIEKRQPVNDPFWDRFLGYFCEVLRRHAGVRDTTFSKWSDDVELLLTNWKTYTDTRARALVEGTAFFDSVKTGLQSSLFSGWDYELRYEYAHCFYRQAWKVEGQYSISLSLSMEHSVRSKLLVEWEPLIGIRSEDAHHTSKERYNHGRAINTWINERFQASLTAQVFIRRSLWWPEGKYLSKPTANDLSGWCQMVEEMMRPLVAIESDIDHAIRDFAQTLR